METIKKIPRCPEDELCFKFGVFFSSRWCERMQSTSVSILLKRAPLLTKPNPSAAHYFAYKDAIRRNESIPPPVADWFFKKG